MASKTVCLQARVLNNLLSAPVCSDVRQASVFAGPHNSRGDLVYPMEPFDAGIVNLMPGSMPLAPNAPAPPVSIDVDQRLFPLLGNPLEAVTDTTSTRRDLMDAG